MVQQRVSLFSKSVNLSSSSSVINSGSAYYGLKASTAIFAIAVNYSQKSLIASYIFPNPAVIIGSISYDKISVYLLWKSIMAVSNSSTNWTSTSMSQSLIKCVYCFSSIKGWSFSSPFTTSPFSAFYFFSSSWALNTTFFFFSNALRIAMVSVSLCDILSFQAFLKFSTFCIFFMFFSITFFYMSVSTASSTFYLNFPFSLSIQFLFKLLSFGRSSCYKRWTDRLSNKCMLESSFSFFFFNYSFSVSSCQFTNLKYSDYLTESPMNFCEAESFSNIFFLSESSIN